MSQERSGLTFGAAAYVLWGLFPLYFPLLEPAGAIEVLAERMVFTLVLMVAFLALTNGFGGVRRVMRDRGTFGTLCASAAMIAINWGVYIWGVNAGHVVECSLGYFINPLFTILLGVVVLRERLRVAQWAAVAVGAIAVVVISVDVGHPPWIALTLAVTFALYGYLKKRANVGAADSLTVETGVQFLPAVITLVVLGTRGDITFADHGVGHSLLLMSTGIVTAVPLVMFAAAAVRLPLSILGLLQYICPVGQFAVGVGLRHEHVPFAEYIGFGLVWVALIVLSVDGLRHQRSSQRTARAAAASVPV